MGVVFLALHAKGLDNVSIVYNFHHARDEMDRFAGYKEVMMPKCCNSI